MKTKQNKHSLKNYFRSRCDRRIRGDKILKRLILKADLSERDLQAVNAVVFGGG